MLQAIPLFDHPKGSQIADAAAAPGKNAKTARMPVSKVNK